jgi:uncharacterized membrane protein YphA (DoxX/SURF4 family)
MKIPSLGTTTARKEGGWERRWGRLSAPRRMFLVALVCQFATVLITWPVWNLRESPINLPLVPTPAVSFGSLVILSLVVALVWPRPGLALHAALYGVACVFDQYRLQPQFLSLIVLMWACVSEEGAWFGRWYLAAMWLWAGLHKLLSVEWFGSLSWQFLESSGIPPAGWHVVFAAVVALGEVGVGLLAIFAPRRAAIPCLVMHLGILLALSPLLHDHNAGVWPWNLATAIVGFWLLRQTAPPPVWRYRYAVTAALFLVPAGYYFDLVNPRLAFVLYSGNLPCALHTRAGSLTRLDGWGGLAVPFPDSPRLFVQVFQRTAAAGDKLHVGDPRWGFADRYFLKAQDGSVREISREQFSRADAEAGEVAGIESESPNAVWRIARSGGVLERDADQVVYSATLAGPECSDEALGQLSELRNLRELKLENLKGAAAALAAAADLQRLQVVEIKGCPLSDDDLQSLARVPTLLWLHLESVGVTSDGLAVLDRLPQLEVLHLPSTRIDDRGLARIGSLSKLRWLDLRDTRVTGGGLAHLQTLRQCEWIDLSGTDVDDEGLRFLRALTSLEVLQLERTKIADAALAHLRGLTRCQHLNLNQTLVTDGGLEHLSPLINLRTLKLRGTLVTAEGVRRIGKALPGCKVEW